TRPARARCANGSQCAPWTCPRDTRRAPDWWAGGYSGWSTPGCHARCAAASPRPLPASQPPLQHFSRHDAWRGTVHPCHALARVPAVARGATGALAPAATTLEHVFKTMVAPAGVICQDVRPHNYLTPNKRSRTLSVPVL